MQRRSNHQNERENRGSGNHRDFKDAAKIGTRLSAEILGKDIEEEKYQSVPQVTRKLHRSKEKLENMPLKKVMNEAKLNKAELYDLQLKNERG